MKRIIYLSLFLFFLTQTSFAGLNKCFDYYAGYKYTLTNFKSDLKERNKFTDDYSQKSHILMRLLSLNASKMSPEEFLNISLYIINRATNFISDYGIYSEGVVQVVSKIVENSRQIPLSFEQAETLRNAIAERPGF